VEKDLLTRFFLEANPREDRRDCPEEAVLQAIAENRLPLNHPARLHLELCSPCFAEFRGFKMEAQDRKRRRSIFRAMGFAACSIVGIVLWRVVPFSQLWPAVTVRSVKHPVEQAEVTRDIDLSGYVTTRGAGDNAVPLKAVSLPTALVHLELLLPRLSPAGHYSVAVSSDRAGDNTIARGQGIATGADPSTTLTVTLDLRNAPPGSYFLSTECDQEAGAYYYPLTLR